MRRFARSVKTTLDRKTSGFTAEAAHESEARYRTLFETLIEGFCTIEMIFDANGKPVDYRFLEINPAFEKQTGLHNAQGKLMRDLAPNHEAHWFELYGNVALTGEPAHFENEAKALGRYYDVRAYRVGGPDSRKVAILFNDITEQKRAERKLQAQLERLSLLQQITRAIGERQDLKSIFGGRDPNPGRPAAHRFRLLVPLRAHRQASHRDECRSAQPRARDGTRHDRASPHLN